VYLRGADMTEAKLTGANWSGADLDWAARLEIAKW